MANDWIEDAADAVTEIISPDANYLDPTLNPEIRYAPDAGLLDLVTWNVIVAYLVGLATSYSYDLLKRKNASDRARDEALEQNLVKLRTKIDSLLEREDSQREIDRLLSMLSSPDYVLVLKERVSSDTTEIEMLLVKNGWPKDLAQRRSAEVARKLQELLINSTT
jgi:hypothetical protein